MHDQLNAQIQKSLKPVTDLTTINVKTLETLAEKQKELFTSLFNTSQAFAEGAKTNTDVTNIIEAQKAYAQTLQDTIVAAAQDAFGVISEAQEKSGEILKEAVSDMQAQVAAATTPK